MSGAVPTADARTGSGNTPAELIVKLRRKKFVRERWVEPVGTMGEPCDEGDEGAEAVLVNPDGPEAADQLTVLTAALSECEDKLWVIHFGLKDEAEREAAIYACNMATAALTGEQG